MTDEQVGQCVVDLIIQSDLVRIDENILVWSVNATEQIGAMVNELKQKGV